MERSGLGDVYDVSGHGTKCASSIAGAQLDDVSSDRSGSIRLDLATGVAPAARLSVVDFGIETRLLMNIEQVDLEYLPVHAAAGAFITSDSWGSYGLGYSVKSRMILYLLMVILDLPAFDRFLWKNPDFISLVAAGNYGGMGYATSTIAAPATAKNVVAVGAGYRAPASANIIGALYFINSTIPGTGGSDLRKFVPEENTDRPLLASLLQNGTLQELVLADPITACDPLDNAAEVAGKVVLVAQVNRVDCDFDVQGRNVAGAGGAAMIVIAFSSSASNLVLSPPYPTAADGLPMSMILRSVGNTLVDRSRYGKVFLAGNTVRLDLDVVADFSSWGPTDPDGRIKPDIIAPGDGGLFAGVAGSGGGCEFTNNWQGTSAATPLQTAYPK
ncbi:hypothetical protein VOLCADRAFT_88679 [Volvox carteri f. nagariensis]|uniref:Peptidase S8/S53 domain-containing protein n=1 Tax=Volvox carteri f. nagariensis TaxID=3068 RepID=D8TPN4_VOLCA|nr:uncharacterized protein VOLCADRAFT_88679 [Volvox carteri f. nagariensis]EFJ50796.1 hypothetical protein VOLCADRAFT_88679 [Volvox carteri f. nagariensis]|eukprot:XP_002948389.1 hypothetical protein VOLCADRAFT_88679 [Volvox carteri f. nagariensis]